METLTPRPLAPPPPAAEPRRRGVARAAIASMVIATLLIATAYASAFLPGGAPRWAPWCLVIALPSLLVGVMVLGAVRPGARVGPLAAPFALVGAMLTIGLALALGLPANEAAGMRLWLGLPLRAAIVLFGIGLLPILILPVAYAITFETQTLRQEDLERVREAGRAWREGQS